MSETEDSILSNRSSGTFIIQNSPNASEHQCYSYDELVSLCKQLEQEYQYIYVLFTSTGETEEKGHLFCVEAEVTVTEYLNFIPNRRMVQFVRMRVLPKQYAPGSKLWKDSRIKLRCVPTLIRWGGPQRLCLDECANYGLLGLLFEEDTPPIYKLSFPKDCDKK